MRFFSAVVVSFLFFSPCLSLLFFFFWEKKIEREREKKCRGICDVFCGLKTLFWFGSFSHSFMGRVCLFVWCGVVRFLIDVSFDMAVGFTLLLVDTKQPPRNVPPLPIKRFIQQMPWNRTQGGKKKNRLFLPLYPHTPPPSVVITPTSLPVERIQESSSVFSRGRWDRNSIANRNNPYSVKWIWYNPWNSQRISRNERESKNGW